VNGACQTRDHGTQCKTYQTQPAEVVGTLGALHVITVAILGDVGLGGRFDTEQTRRPDLAFGARFGSGLDQAQAG
jgi:hypothetical protein